MLGPTASGKSDLAVALARTFNGEVISADSRQVYRGLDIGSGKITKKERRGIPHHLLDVASPARVFTAAQFQQLAATAIQKIAKKGKLPIVAGGTGMYIDALIYNWKLPQVKPNSELRRKLDKMPAEKLYSRLLKLDPKRSATIDPHNKRRLIRALEIISETKEPIPNLKKESPYDALKIGIRLPDRELKKRIHNRLLGWLRKGLLREIKKLHAQGVSWEKLDSFGLEYRQASRYLRGLITKREMIQKSEIEIRRYAKRQITWWKRDRGIRWVGEKSEVLKEIRAFLIK